MQRTFYWLLSLAIFYAVWVHLLKPTPSLDQLLQSSQIAQGVQQVDGYQVIDLESYQGEFRILSREDYSFGTEAKFSPVDFAVGWGAMADPKVYSQINISQSNRWYRWQVDHEPPIPLREIAISSANMHMIPANKAIAEQLKDIKKGDLVYLKGALVEIKSSDGWTWRSSLTREDTGGGACELMRVDEVRVISSV
jgi:hypothetical protein